jgi:hypothetical protein
LGLAALPGSANFRGWVLDKRLLMRYNTFVVERRVPFVAFLTDLPHLGQRPNSRNPFRIHSYEKTTRKSFVSHSYKIIGLKVPSNHTLTKKGGGRGLLALASPVSICPLSIRYLEYGPQR